MHCLSFAGVCDIASFHVAITLIFDRTVGVTV